MTAEFYILLTVHLDVILLNDCGLTKEIRPGYFGTKSKHEYIYMLSQCLF
jgi:hypothetical protein